MSLHSPPQRSLTIKHIDASGHSIPALGFGTFELKPDDAQRMVAAALGIGYRHIDTAQMYENEEAVGAGIRDSGVSRDQIWLTTKIHPRNFHDGDLQRSVDDSLRKLGADHVDLILLHWPSFDVPLGESLEALMEVREQGKTRAIGVSNFTAELLREATDICGGGVLAINQIEYHPYLSQQTVIKQIKALGMAPTAYCPIAQGKVIGDDTLKQIGQLHGKSEVQVTLRWLIQQGVISIPRTSKERNAQANFEIFDFQLTPEQMKHIDALQGDGRLIDPSFAPDWDRP